MASIRKLKTGKWLAEIRIKGSQPRSKTFDNKTEAKGWAEEEERRIKKSSDIIYGKTLGDAFKRYAREESPLKKGARWEIIRLEKFQRDPIAKVQVMDLRPSDFEAMIQRMRDSGLMESSIRRELHAISPVISKCRKWGWLDGNPLEGVETPSESPHRDKTYTDAQISRICEALDYKEGEPVITARQKIAVAFMFAIETAMRQGEIWGMTWDHVNLDKQFVHLPDTKTNVPRDVPLSKRACALLRMLPKTEGTIFQSQASAGTIFRRALVVAEIEGMTFHDARHTATTRLASRIDTKTGTRMDMLTLAKITGHKDPRMLMRYYNPTASDIAQRLD